MPTIQSLASSTGMMGSFPERSQGSLGQVRAQPAPGENPPYRVRQVRCRAPSRPGQGKAGNVRFLGVHTLLQHPKKDSADFQLGRKTQRKRMKAKIGIAHV